jgi:glycosyltransferase involved in cell wall biosynthesis
VSGRPSRWNVSRVAYIHLPHPQTGKTLFARHDVTARELSYCYQQARAVVFPSQAEGFELPIIEAQWHRRQVFASDIPVHRKVDKDNCVYCDLSNSRDVADKILDWEAKGRPQSTLDPK